MLCPASFPLILIRRFESKPVMASSGGVLGSCLPLPGRLGLEEVPWLHLNQTLGCGGPGGQQAGSGAAVGLVQVCGG